MRKTVSWILILSLFCCLTACKAEEAIQSPVTFYYQNKAFSHGSGNSVILGEVRESAGTSEDISELLNLYLKGPVSENLLQTFPNGTKLQSFRIDGEVAYAVLSDQITLADGIELTVACGCLTKTVIELTGVTGVNISAENLPLGNNQSIYMDLNSLLLLDSSSVEN